MTRTVLLAVLALLALLALPAAATAAPVKISPRASSVSAAGVATVEVANPNRHVLRGTATVTVGGRTVARRSVRLGKLSVATLKLNFDSKAVDALRGAGGKATIKLRVRRAARTFTARRTLTLSVAAAPQAPGAPAPAPGAGSGTGAPTGSGGQPTPAPPAPASNTWVGRMGAEGPYDDLELTVSDGQMQVTKTPFVPVACFENGGAYRSSLSFELFSAPGPWTLGSDATVAQQGIAVNQLVGGGARTINYKITGSTQSAGLLKGTLGMSFVDSKYDFITNKIIFINCAGSQSFEAVPAG